MGPGPVSCSSSIFCKLIICEHICQTWAGVEYFLEYRAESSSRNPLHHRSWKTDFGYSSPASFRGRKAAIKTTSLQLPLMKAAWRCLPSS